MLTIIFLDNRIRQQIYLLIRRRQSLRDTMTLSRGGEALTLHLGLIEKLHLVWDNYQKRRRKIFVQMFGEVKQDQIKNARTNIAINSDRTLSHPSTKKMQGCILESHLHDICRQSSKVAFTSCKVESPTTNPSSLLPLVRDTVYTLVRFVLNLRKLTATQQRHKKSWDQNFKARFRKM